MHILGMTMAIPDAALEESCVCLRVKYLKDAILVRL